MSVSRSWAGVALAMLAALSLGCGDAGSAVSQGEEDAAAAPQARSIADVAPAASEAAQEASPTVQAKTEPGAGQGTAAEKKPAEVVHLAPQQVAVGGDGRARNITFDALKFPMEDPKSRKFSREMLTPSIEKLSGTRIRIRGFMFPQPLEEVSNFIFVRDNQECCFGPGSALYDSIMVNLAPGEVTPFQTRPITVEGQFEVRELIGPDKTHWSIYHITATKVE